MIKTIFQKKDAEVYSIIYSYISYTDIWIQYYISALSLSEFKTIVLNPNYSFLIDPVIKVPAKTCANVAFLSALLQSIFSNNSAFLDALEHLKKYISLHFAFCLTCHVIIIIKKTITQHTIVSKF